MIKNLDILKLLINRIYDIQILKKSILVTKQHKKLEIAKIIQKKIDKLEK